MIGHSGGRSGPRVSQRVLAHLAEARACLDEAAAAATPAERYVAAHLAALRAAAGLIAARPARIARRRRLRSAWEMLPEAEPGLAEWAAYFQLSAAKRAAAEAGMVRGITRRDADELLAEAGRFVAEVESILGVTSQPVLPLAG